MIVTSTCHATSGMVTRQLTVTHGVFRWREILPENATPWLPAKASLALQIMEASDAPPSWLAEARRLADLEAGK